MFQKTVAINDFYLRGPDTAYPLGQIQSQGRTHGVMAQIVVPWIPLWAYEAWVARGVDWLAMSEDLPSPDNRVTLEPDGRIRLHYRPNNLAAHKRLVKEAYRMLWRLGFWSVVKHSHHGQNTTHQCGTLVFRHRPATSVLDTYCRAHDVENLFVVDASFFPSSAAVNPALTIVAQALRVADHIKDTDLEVEQGDTARERTSGSFSHVGITVSSFNKAVQFYWEVFGCPLVGVADTPPERVRDFFGVNGEAPRCKIGWIRVPGGGVLEIFEFQPQLAAERISWNRVGLTHFSFNVRHLQRWYDRLVSQGVECVSKPERSPRGHSFFFAKDFDGNLIELMDLGYMYHVLGWLGPLGGWIFRRGMYRQVLRARRRESPCGLLISPSRQMARRARVTTHATHEPFGRACRDRMIALVSLLHESPALTWGTREADWRRPRRLDCRIDPEGDS